MTLVGFLSTLAGVFIAFGLSLWYDRRSRKAKDRETNRRIMLTLHSELNLNHGELDHAREDGLLVSHFMRNSAFQSAVGGGHLSMLNPKLQSSVGDAYYWTLIDSVIEARVFDLERSEAIYVEEGKSTLENFRQELKRTHDILRKEIPKTLRLLEEELKL